MDSGADTPEGFLNETKFVVLSFLGLVPPDFDPGFSEFDIQSSDSSHPQTPFSLAGSDEGNSHCASPRFLSVKSRHTHCTSRSQSFSPSSAKSRSPALSPRGSQKRREKVKVERDQLHTETDVVTGSGAAIHIEKDVIQVFTEVSKASPGNGEEKKGGDDDLETDGDDLDPESEEGGKETTKQESSSTTTTTVETSDTIITAAGAAPVPPFLETSAAAAPEINIVSPGATPSAFVSVSPSSGDSPRLLIPPQNDQSSGSSSSEIGKDSDSGLLNVDESWSGCKRKSIEELTEPLREELEEAFNQLGLEKTYADHVIGHPGSNQSGDSNMSPTVVPSICPIAREALVAERIAHIGDMIMAQHKEELEQAMQQVFGQAANGGSLNYLMFKSLMQHMVRSAVPEWYHLALMLNVTRRMAFGFLKRGNQSMGYLSDFAVRYIEENLAETIIEQGGWDAMFNVNPEEVEELSSRSVSPMPPDFLSYSSPLPSSPAIVMESPVDPPIWQHQTTTHLHVTTVSQSDVIREDQSFDSLTNVMSEIKPSETTKLNSVPTSVDNKPDTLCDGVLKPNPSETVPSVENPDGTLPSLEQSGIDQAVRDGSDGNSAPEDHTVVDSISKDEGDGKSVTQYILATAAGAAAAAGAVYALMKK